MRTRERRFPSPSPGTRRPCCTRRPPEAFFAANAPKCLNVRVGFRIRVKC